MKQIIFRHKVILLKGPRSSSLHFSTPPPTSAQNTTILEPQSDVGITSLLLSLVVTIGR